MILDRDAIDQSVYYEHGTLYYTQIEEYLPKPPDILPERMQNIGYKFSGRALYVYDDFGRICQTWLEIYRGHATRYILLA